MAEQRIGEAGDFDRAIRTALAAADRDLMEGLRQARALVRTWPDAPIPSRILAVLLRRAKRDREADAVDLETIRISGARPTLIAIEQAIAAGNLETAEILLREHLKRDPEDAFGAKILADIAVRSGAIREAEIFYKRTLLLAPGYHEARQALAFLYSRSGRTDEAFATLEEALARDPENFGVLALKAAMLGHGRKLGEADRLFRKITTHHPRNPQGWRNYAYLLKTVNRTEEAVAAYRKAISLDKTSGASWFGLADLKTVRFDQADIAAMQTALTKSDAQDEQRPFLEFALARGLDAQRDFAAAFDHYRSGNALRRRRFPHDADAASAEVDQIERVFTPALIAAREGAGAPARDPIFIVSLPRSGSTLVEQILASHPLVEGTEELYDIEGIARGIGKVATPAAYLDEIAALPPAKLKALGEQYIASTRKHRTTDRPYFTDKMPSNWKYAGLIHLILPNAKIIDIRRHPLGCGLANFMQLYNWGINFSYDLKDIGRFYADYVRQMAHFDRIMPGAVHRIFYENLVDDFEAEVRRLLDYLGLPFDPACLAFHENKRPVHTPSAEQVRQPINRAGVERWQRYEPFLDPLKDALGPVLSAYPAVPETWPGQP